MDREICFLFEHENRSIPSVYCILHQKVLCIQLCSEQLGEVIALVNFIVARGLNDCQYNPLMDEVGNNYPGLLLHSNVQRLSGGKVISRLAALLSKIRTFLEMKNIKHPELTLNGSRSITFSWT